DYEAGRIGQALDHLERARQLGIEETDAGLVDFYLASAYALDDQPAAAQSTYAAAAGAYEERATSERLGPQDELVLVTTYLALGNLAREAGEWQTAIQWLQKGIAHRDELLARASGLDRPSDVNEVYTRVYGQLATAYRATGDREEEIFWAKRADDEVQTLAGRVGNDDRAGLVRLSATRLAVGDCVGAVDAVNRALAIAPGDPDALLNAAAIAFLQSDAEAARTHLSGVAPGNPVAVRAHDELGLLSTLAAVNSTDGFLEPAFLAEARTVLEAVASPSGLALQELGVAAAWEGDATMLDLTSLYGGDDLTAAKSRIEWSADPVRRQVAIDAYTRAIARLTELTTRRPNDPAVAAALAGAYAGRMSAYAAGSISGTGGTDQDVPLLLADAAAVRVWADKVLAANSGATRRDRLAAWALTLEAMNDSRLAGASRGEPVDALRQVVEQAKSEAQIAPPTDDLEAAAIRAIFDEIIHYATTVAPDPAQAADAVTARAAVAGPSPVDQALLRTVCREERERLGGDTLLAAVDPVSAQARYEAALQANPRFAPALIGLSAARERQGDPAGAVAQAAAASDAAPNLPAAWQSLGIAQLTAGNAADRDAAFDRFFALVAEEPSQVRTAHLRLAIASVRDVLDRHADLAPAVRELIPRFQVALDASPQETGEYQRAARYAELGSLALTADDATIAESLLRRSLELDQHQPLVLTDLALAVLVQGRDATTEIQAALDETEEPLWEAAGIAQADLLKRMADRIAEYKRRSPERAPMLEPLADAIAQAEAAATPPEGGTPIAEASPRTGAASPEVESPLVATPSAQATYESPTFGFTLTMTDGWTILQTIQEESIEGVQLSNGISFISVFIFQAPDTTPAQCLQQRHSDLAAEEGVSDVALLTGSDGKAIRGSSDEHAFAAFRFTYGIEDGMPPDRVKYISCRGYPDLGAILLVEQVAPAESYEEQAAAREELLATLVLPEP
ncbi:MAG: MalT-like region, partial [Thermomicrobiales bacterium]|nr:MalT-like region [Thermomicrobiales bacterium]